MGKIWAVNCNGSGMIPMGKYTPPNKPCNVPINHTRGSPFLNMSTNAADKTPTLEKEIMLNKKIVLVARMSALLKSKPKNETPNMKYIITLMEVKTKSQILEPIIIVGTPVGVVITASSVPVICSCLRFPEKLCKLVVRYSEKAIPINTKGK
jgi:hypothetical protein